MKIEDLCGDCRVKMPRKEHQNRFVLLGSPTRSEGAVGKSGHWLEVTKKYKCPECGARWENLVESGAGGHGNFWARMDPPPSK